jgi:hypothetical protein
LPRISSGVPVAITWPYTSTLMRSLSENTTSMSCSTIISARPRVTSRISCAV